MFIRKFTLKTPSLIIRNYREEVNFNGFRGRLNGTDILNEAVTSRDIKSAQDWRDVKDRCLTHEDNRGQISKINIDALLIGFCTSIKQYDLGCSYYDFLKEEKIKPNLATVGKYLKLLYLRFIEESAEINEAEILALYEEIKTTHPVLDSFSLESIILAISLTKSWRDCIKLLEEIKVSAVPNHSAYSAVISAAFLNGDGDLAWRLLNEMLENDRLPRSIAYQSYIDSIKKTRTKKAVIEKLEKLFNFFKENQLRPDKKFITKLSDLEKILKSKCTFTSINPKGYCKACNEKLEQYEITNKEFNELKEKLLKNVILGKDIFVKTNPQELTKFKRFIKDLEEYDVVLDGLNVAYSAGTKHPPHIFAALVENTVKYFVDQNKKVLVLGRVHMNRWPKQHWSYVTDNSTVFLTQNISQDDPYLLYCALHSGKNTIIVTRDLMRGHKFLLREPKYKALFSRWLAQIQYQLVRVDQRGIPRFKVPLPYDCVTQNSAKGWHILYDEVESNKNEHENTWSCMKF